MTEVLDLLALYPLDKFNLLVNAWTPTGSAYICDPQVTDTDIDYGIWTSSLDKMGVQLMYEDWDVNWDDEEYRIDSAGEHPFITARKGRFNLIIFEDGSGYAAYEAATQVAKKLNIKDKEDRVLLFQAVCSNRYVPCFP